MGYRRTLSLFLALSMAVGGLVVPRFGFGALPPEEAGVSISIEISGEAPPPSPEQGIFTGQFITPPLGILVLRGFAPPRSFLTVSRNTSVGATLEVSRDGTFEVAFSSLSENTYELRLFVEDPEGNVSQTIVLSSVPVFRSGTTTVSSIVLPPTFVLDTPRIEEESSSNVRMHGFTVPRSSVILLVFPSRGLTSLTPPLFFKTVTSNSRGSWNVSFPAKELSRGDFKLKAQTQLSSGLFSNFSQFLDLEILSAIPSVSPEEPGEIPPTIPPTAPPSPEISPRPSLPESLFLKVDLNGDGKVDIIDLSILLYNWGVPKNPKADFNGDGIVDLVDFSIMLFYWTG